MIHKYEIPAAGADVPMWSQKENRQAAYEEAIKLGLAENEFTIVNMSNGRGAKIMVSLETLHRLADEGKTTPLIF